MTTANEEEWRPVVGFDGYEVSSFGRVRSWKRCGSGPPRAMTAWTEKDGYLMVNLRKDGKHWGRMVHRLVLEAFVGPCPEGLIACHGDGNPSNAHIGNLRWDSYTANAIDSIKHGTRPRGSVNPAALLVEQDVLAIVERLGRGEKQVHLAPEYGVSVASIGAIKSGKTWGWLTGRAA